MKIKKFNESSNYIPANEDDLKFFISDIISGEVDMRQVQYGEPDEMELDYNSIDKAAKNIVKELKRIGVDFDLLFTSGKYNL